MFGLCVDFERLLVKATEITDLRTKFFFPLSTSSALSVLQTKMSLAGSSNTAKGTILYLSLSLVFLAIAVDAYTPIDNFIISCGSDDGSSSDGDQTWTGDINSKYLLTIGSQQDKPSVAERALTQSSTNSVPYTTARLSYSNFTYSFPVTPGQIFIRLYFYPTSYEQGFNRSKSFFSVTSGAFTLLKDFNASLTADADDDPRDTIFREYSINVDEGQRLNVTFSPSTIQPDLYAFINGIEILSMPTNLYYTDSLNTAELKLVGSTSFYSILNDSALKTEYRLNVGGSDIPPSHDTGLLRYWENDQKYVTTLSALSVDYNGSMLSFTQVPNYTAPDPVYRTVRSMGMNSTLNKMSNLTWEFPVDPGFTYMLRLHFCEFRAEVSPEIVFNIYIDDKLAEDAADVLKWSKQKATPVYRDYAVQILGNEKYSLSLKLHPNQDIRKTAYFDAYLNGLEIFRISDPQTYNLAGPNPDPLPPAPPGSQPPTQNQKKSGSTTIIGIVAGVVAGVVLLFLLVAFFLVRRGKKFKSRKSSDGGTSKWAPFSFATTKSSQTRTSSSLPSDLCRYFSLAEIKAATNNFDDLFKVGVGGFGNVYKGYIDDNTTAVAIKRLKPGSQQGAREFQTEIEMLSQLRHLHLVSLIGYCNESNEMILVYDYMGRGTLRDHLYNTDNSSLPWKQRLQICIGSARGLHYLHTGAKHMIIHRDVKTTNILLDEKWVAKVSDFGLSRIGPTGMSKAHVSTVVKGSVGYLDPEYYKRQRLTEKSDVYSFGVVLFEVVCARPPLIRTTEKKQVSLADWARHCYYAGSLGQIVDPTLKGKIAPECLRKFGEIAVNCLLDDGSQRPSMNDVVWGLEFALQLQENAEQRDPINYRVDLMEGVGIGNEDSDDMFSGSSVGIVSDFNKSSGVSMTSSASGEKESDKLMSESAFSEIVDPKAR